MEIKLKVEVERGLDPRETARLARRAFGKNASDLSAERFNWTYGHGYDRTIVVSAFVEGEKVGQAAAIIKTVGIDRNLREAAELVDLFVSPEHRSYKIVSEIYKELRKQIKSYNIDLIYTYPNNGANLLNRRFFRLDDNTQLQIKVGFSFGSLFSTRKDGVTLHSDVGDMANLCCEYFKRGSGNGIYWTRDQFRKRLDSPIHDYICASDRNLAILASPRTIRSVPVLLICGTFMLGTGSCGAGTARGLVSSLCAATGRPLYLYVGWNNELGTFPGSRMPDIAVRGKFTIQSNFLNSRKDEINRFELIDIDYG